MKRLLILLTLLALLTLPALAQTPEPTPETTPSEVAQTPTPAPIETPVAPIVTDIPDSVIADYLEAQPDLMVDLVEVGIAGVGLAYERSQWQGIVSFVALVVMAVVGGYALYRSTPPDQKPVIARQIGSAGSAILGGIDKLDLLPMTDIENVLLRAAKKAIDDKLAEITAVVDAKVQSLYDADVEKRRQNANAKEDNFVLNVLTPDGPA
jgi:hypothetical protein